MRRCRKAIRRTETAPRTRGRGSPVRLFVVTTALGMVLLGSSAQAAEIPPLTGCGGCRETALGTLASGKSETGGWSASISAAKGGPQAQAAGVISFPIKLEEKEEGPVFTYRSAEEALKPEAPCLGSVDEPIAEKGNLCVYRGGAGNGSKEGEDRNVTNKKGEVFFQSFFGEKIAKQEGVSGQAGVDLIFRTKQFNATGAGEPAEVTATSYMAAQGSWSVTAK